MIDALPLLLGPEGYQISRSVRLRASASASFARTPAGAGNRKTWTWSGWVKRGALSSSGNLVLFDVQINANNWFTLWFRNDAIGYDVSYISSANRIILSSTAVFRDPSAWCHIVLSVDTTQATAANRIRIYTNGSDVALNSYVVGSGYVALNTDTAINTTTVHNIGRRGGSSVDYFDGYLTEINFIDGQALDPSSFGETNLVTGVWQPKKYAGTYGTNGFYLNFSDNSAATAAAIGKDYSGNGNNWTPNNISVTAGATYDSMLDVPTQWADGGNGRGNYPVMNPLDVAPTEFSGRATFSNGNLTLVGANQFARGWLMPTTGQWYWEITLLDAYNGNPPLIWGDHGVSSGLIGNCTGIRLWASTGGGILQDGVKVQTFSTWANNDIIGFAYDAGTRSMSVYRNGSQLGTSVTANATDKYFYSFLNGTADTSSVAYNFGQRPFAYTPPTGFKALNTLNLPTPTILKGNQYFDATTYTGNGSTRSVVNSGAMQPDLVWVKRRQAAADHALYDSSRTLGVALSSNSTGAEGAVVTNGLLTSFNSNGFGVAVVSGDNTTNELNGSFVGWQWKEGPTQGFDIVTYTGDGVSSRTVAHSLGVTPAMIITKPRSATGDWFVAHRSLGNGNLILNQTLQSYNPATQFSGGGLAAPNSSTTFGFAAGSGGVGNANANGVTYVAYLFSEVAGYSKFGSYTGNGSADGPMIFTGFLPRWVMMKAVDATNANDWVIIDTTRKTSNNNGVGLRPNLSSAEFDDSGITTNGINIDVLSNGFKPRGTSTRINGSGGTYIYAAFSETSFKYALGR